MRVSRLIDLEAYRPNAMEPDIGTWLAVMQINCTDWSAKTKVVIFEPRLTQKVSQNWPPNQWPVSSWWSLGCAEVVSAHSQLNPSPKKLVLGQLFALSLSNKETRARQSRRLQTDLERLKFFKIKWSLLKLPLWVTLSCHWAIWATVPAWWHEPSKR